MPGLFHKAFNFVLRQEVRLQHWGPLGIFFSVGKQTVIRRNADKSYSCSCSWFAIKAVPNCSHIKAVELWFQGYDLRLGKPRENKVSSGLVSGDLTPFRSLGPKDKQTGVKE